MKPLRFTLLGVASLMALTGCGGGGKTLLSAVKASTGRGRATFTIKWPARTRLIPDAASAIKIDLLRGTTHIDGKLLGRPTNGGTATVTFDALPIGDMTATATAYPNMDGTGTAQATASVPLHIQDGQNTAFSLTMASTIDHLELSPTDPKLKVGGTLQPTLAAKDAAGAIVLLSPSKLQWKSSNTTVATVDTTTGKVTAVNAGSADISVTDTESNKTAKVTLTVSLLAPIQFQSPALYNIAAPSELVTADFDGDGNLDVAVGTSTSLAVFWGKGDGTLEGPQTVLTWAGGIRPYSAADMNGDGKPDLVCVVDSQVIVVNNMGGRQFAGPIAVPIGASVGPLVTGDFNGDGRPDVAVIVYDHPGSTSTDVFIFQNQGNGTFQQLPTVGNIWIIMAITAGDMNGDGKTDLLVSIVTDEVGGSGANVYYGDGTGHFTGGPGVGTASFNVNWTTIADLNGDGKQDFAITNDTDGTLSVMFNTGNGTFTAPAYYPAGGAPDRISAADFDGDGKPDLVVEDRGQNYFTVLRNENALFPNPVPYPIGNVQCGPLTVADINKDGKPDVIFSSPNTNNLCVMLNNTQ